MTLLQELRERCESVVADHMLVEVRKDELTRVLDTHDAARKIHDELKLANEELNIRDFTLTAERDALRAEVERMRAVWLVALEWRRQLIEVNGRIHDTDDGSCEPGLARPPIRVLLMRAIDAACEETP